MMAMIIESKKRKRSVPIKKITYAPIDERENEN
jgi:hypothetical protein